MSDQHNCSDGAPNTRPAADEARRPSRRDVLRAAGTVTAGAVLAQWARRPVYAVQSPRVIGANDRIRMGIIGCGGMGTNHLRGIHRMGRDGRENVEIIAVCDIYQRHKERAANLTGARAYHDYRELLDNKDVDAVLIATPEHWHARMAIDAMEAGKDLYLEKPMVRYLEEAKQVYQTAVRTNRVVQVGSQATQEGKWRKANEMIRAGKIGKPVWSQTSYCRNSRDGEWNYGIDADASPENLDWNAFLGPAPKRPFDRDRFFRWRKYWDYSAGISSDLFPHVMHTLYLALDAGFPTRVAATGGIYVHTDREVPDTIHLLVDFADGHTMMVAGCTANERGLETMIHGHKANLFLAGNDVVLRPERVYADEVEEATEPAMSPEDQIRAHERNFLQCVRTREKPACPIDLAYKVQVAVSLCEMSYRQNKVMRYDPEKQEVL